MHISHVQWSFSIETGGPLTSTTNYCLGQAKRGHRVSLWVLDGYPDTSPAVQLAPPIEEHVHKVGFPAKLGRSAGLRRALLASEPADIYHLHGAWTRAMYYGAMKARRAGRPYIVEPQGMYEPFAIKQKPLRKAVSRWWFQDGMMHGASCLHACSSKEAQSLRDLGFRAPIMLLPAGVDMEAINTRLAALGATEAEAPWPEIAGRPFFLFLSRVHKNKGIEPLLEAWARIAAEYSDWALAVAGPPASPEYASHLLQMAKSLGVEGRVHWLGKVSEAQKSWLYSRAAVYVLPSFSENFGNTVPEAMAHGTAVVATKNTPWKVVADEGCGWFGEPTVDSLEPILREAAAAGAAARQQMGERGRALVQSRYSLDYVMDAMVKVYSWVIQGGPEPDCLFRENSNAGAA